MKMLLTDYTVISVSQLMFCGVQNKYHLRDQFYLIIFQFPRELRQKPKTGLQPLFWKENERWQFLVYSTRFRHISFPESFFFTAQFRYIKIQSNTIDLSTRLWAIIYPTNSVFIRQGLVMRSIVLG